MARREPAFATEVDLCAAFLRQIGDEWTPYAETAGFDILLVRNADGFQIGVQAKLKLNASVINQAMEDQYGQHLAGPDCRAVLIPAGVGGDLAGVAAYIGLTVIRVEKHHYYPRLPIGRWDNDWHELCPTSRCKLPEYVPDVPAGSSAPVQLTEWKIGALKLAVLLEHRGYLVRDDFKRFGVDIRRWIAPGTRWLKPSPQGFVADTHLPNFKDQHPSVFEQIKADRAKWMPPSELVA